MATVLHNSAIGGPAGRTAGRTASIYFFTFLTAVPPCP
jgi:hypothetical protein